MEQLAASFDDNIPKKTEDTIPLGITENQELQALLRTTFSRLNMEANPDIQKVDSVVGIPYERYAGSVRLSAASDGPDVSASIRAVQANFAAPATADLSGGLWTQGGKIPTSTEAISAWLYRRFPGEHHLAKLADPNEPTSSKDLYTSLESIALRSRKAKRLAVYCLDDIFMSSDGHYLNSCSFQLTEAKQGTKSAQAMEVNTSHEIGNAIVKKTIQVVNSNERLAARVLLESHDMELLEWFQMHLKLENEQVMALESLKRFNRERFGQPF